MKLLMKEHDINLSLSLLFGFMDRASGSKCNYKSLPHTCQRNVGTAIARVVPHCQQLRILRDLGFTMPKNWLHVFSKGEGRGQKDCPV